MGNSELIQRIKSGDESIIKQIYQEYKNPFIKWIGQKFKLAPGDALEIFQYAVVAMYDNIVEGKLQTLTGSIKTYLYSIGKNKAYELIRNQNRFTPTADQMIIQHILCTVEDESNSLENELKIVDEGMKILGDPGRSILQNFYYYRLTMDEIAKKMNYKNADTVKNLKYKSMKRLQINSLSRVFNRLVRIPCLIFRKCWYLELKVLSVTSFRAMDSSSCLVN